MLKMIFISLFVFSGIYIAHADVKSDYARFTSSDDSVIQQATTQIAQLTNSINILNQIIQNATIDKNTLNTNLNAVLSNNAVASLPVGS